MEEVIDKVVEYLDNSINKIDNVYYSIYEKSESVYLELFFPKNFKFSKFDLLMDKVNNIYKTVLNYKYEIKISDSDYDDKEDENYIIFRIKKFSYHQNYNQNRTNYTGGQNNYNDIYNKKTSIKPEFNRTEWERNLSPTGIEIGGMEAIEVERGLIKKPMDREEIDYVTSILKLMSTQGTKIDGPHKSHSNYDHFWLIYVTEKDGSVASSSYSLSVKKLSNETFVAKLIDFKNFSKMTERYLYMENIIDFSGIATLNKFDI